MSSEDARDIRDIQQRLDHINDSSPFWVSKDIKELRDYVFQVHGEYELSLEMIIERSYFKSVALEVPYRDIFSVLGYIDKLKLIKNIHFSRHAFPRGKADRINTLRNDFAHKDGLGLRIDYMNKLPETYRELSAAHDDLGDFWMKVQKDDRAQKSA